ncbi:drug/metabolite transporter (DMT)-like permease [Aurantimicrobium minutum]|uniref:DMT family transporter n=1 Tax=Aurantimicrobium minutum TaxID=708131 RepID=UPI002472F224|nr:DMT family transporter [Aurantimicrobium minutum]MDH6277964.1 drug/metabolite transporter (DMT)-like permease [Aurantimicrobium minutum]
MLGDLPDLSQVHFEPSQLIGIPFALVGAVLMSIGAQLQHRGVGKVGDDADEGSSSLNFKQLLGLFRRPSWLTGTLLLGGAIVFQLISLGFSPLIVVQPIGAVALVMTAILNSRVSKTKLNKESILAITLSVGGIGIFVSIAAFTAVNAPMTSADLAEILIILLIVLAIFGALFLFLGKHLSALYYIVGAGVLYGFVATLAKVVITSITHGATDWLTWACLAALLAATILGALFVQNAYSSGPPDLVIAGLTVIDPIVAVTIGIVILDEASQAPPWAIVAYIIAGVLAVIGVFLLAKYHPDAHEPLAEASAEAKAGFKGATADSKAKVNTAAHGAKEAIKKAKSVN